MPMPRQSKSEVVYRDGKIWCHTECKEYKGSLTWTIGGFSRCEYEVGKCLTSAYFGIEGEEESSLNLLLYPRGKTEEYKDFVAVFLHSASDENMSDVVECEISIVDADGEKMKKKKLLVNESDGFEDFISRNVLFLTKEVLLPGDALTVHCEIVTVKKFEKIWKSGPKCSRSFGGDVRREKTLASDFGELLQKDLLTDVVLQVGETKISAHKFVLVARSSVLGEMLRQDDPETQTTNNVVIIKDIEVQVFRELLSYIYTNECDLFSVQFAVKLLAAADRFAISSLKTKCYGYINDNLSSKQAFEILTGTSDFAEGKLRQKCIDVFCNGLSDLAASGGDWRNKLPSNSGALEDIFNFFAGKKNYTGNFSVVSASNCSFESKESFEHTQFVDRTASLLWRISGFSRCRHLENTKCFLSHKFGIDNDRMKFCLELYPNGERKAEKGFVTMCLRAEPREAVTMKHSVCVKSTDGKEIVVWESDSTDLAKYSGASSNSLIALEKLFGDDSLLQDDELVVLCSVSVSKLCTGQPTQLEVNSLAEDLGRMFDKQACTDVVLDMKTTKIKANERVLSSRSSVLASMLAESEIAGSLDVTDTKAHVLRKLVRYLHTDTCSLKNVDVALDMLAASHKYDVPSLQAKCCEYLCDNLSEHNVFDVVVSAFDLQEKKLYEICLDYICQELPPVSFLPWRLEDLHEHPDIFKDAIARYIA